MISLILLKLFTFSQILQGVPKLLHATVYIYIYYIKIWHAATNNGINLFKIIVINNRNYNLKGIIDNYDFCHNRAALTRNLYCRDGH